MGCTKIDTFIMKSRCPLPGTKHKNLDLKIFIAEREKAVVLPELLSSRLLKRTIVSKADDPVDVHALVMVV